MTKQQILNHFKNGDVVECEWSKLIGIFNEESLFIFRDDWAFVDKETNHTIILEHNGKLARIIQPDKTEVYAQLGKEVEEILKQWPNNDKAGQLIRKLFEQ